jgi:hypothetical protein
MDIDTMDKWKSHKGKSELVNHLMGKKLSFRKVLLAKCYECMNGYIDGTMDCKILECPLYPFMPYKDKE